MKKELFKKIEFPEGVEVNIDGSILKVKGPAGEAERDLNIANLELKKEGNNILIGHKKATKNEKKLINTLAAHIKNLVMGASEKFEYKLKIVSSHFPMSVDVSGNEATIKNFLGEKTPRIVRIPRGAEVSIEGDMIIVKSNNKEFAGQAAANFENATRIRLKDRRIFQDGIFILNKAGREL